MIPLVNFEDEYFDLFLVSSNLTEDLVESLADELERITEDGEGIDETTN